MGWYLPKEPWTIDPAKTYWVVVYTWSPWPGPAQCYLNRIANAAASRLGQVIIDWLDAGKQCTYDTLIRPPFSGVCELIKSIEEM